MSDLRYDIIIHVERRHGRGGGWQGLRPWQGGLIMIIRLLVMEVVPRRRYGVVSFNVLLCPDSGLWSPCFNQGATAS